MGASCSTSSANLRPDAMRPIRAASSVVAASALALVLAGCGDRSGPHGQDSTVAGEPLGRVSLIDARTLAAKAAAGEVELVDVRTPQEFAEGHLAGAINVPLDRFDPATLPQQPGKQTVLYCRSGRRSGMAGEKLAEATGENVTHLDGGIVAWQAAGLPVVE